jgi:hypothetical protein
MLVDAREAYLFCCHPVPVPMSFPFAAPPVVTAQRSVDSPLVPAAEKGVERELRWLRVVLGLSFLATLALSWRLWLSSARDYPLVPVIDGLPQPPFPLDWLLLGGMAAALVGMSFTRRPRRYAAAVLAIMAVWLVLDQTRWQPYILTFLAATACVALGESPSVRAPGDASPRWHMAPYQLSLVALYFYAGLHKLNVRFVELVFPAWASPVTRRLGVDPAAIPEAMLWAGVAAAASETVLGLALLWPRTRRMAVVGLTGIHVCILLIVSLTGGVQAMAVVWPWNVLMVATLWLLFWPRTAGARLDGFIRAWWRGVRGRGGAPPVPRPLRLAWGVVMVGFGVLPALSFAQMWDASLSFQLYAGNQRHVRLHYRAEQRDALPPALQRAERTRGQVDLIRWAAMELNVAPVMETRVVTRIGRELARRAPDAGVSVVIAGPSGRLSGERDYRSFIYRGPAQLPREVSTVAPIPGIGPMRRREPLAASKAD